MHTYSTLDYLEKCYLSVLEWVRTRESSSESESTRPESESESIRPESESIRCESESIGPEAEFESIGPQSESESASRVQQKSEWVLTWVRTQSGLMSPTVEKCFISTLLLIIFAKWLHILIIILGQNWIDWYTEMCHFFLENWNNVCVHFPVAHPFRNGQT